MKYGEVISMVGILKYWRFPKPVFQTLSPLIFKILTSFLCLKSVLMSLRTCSVGWKLSKCFCSVTLWWSLSLSVFRSKSKLATWIAFREPAFSARKCTWKDTKFLPFSCDIFLIVMIIIPMACKRTMSCWFIQLQQVGGITGNISRKCETDGIVWCLHLQGANTPTTSEVKGNWGQTLQMYPVMFCYVCRLVRFGVLLFFLFNWRSLLNSSLQF